MALDAMASKDAKTTFFIQRSWNFLKLKHSASASRRKMHSLHWTTATLCKTTSMRAHPCNLLDYRNQRLPVTSRCSIRTRPTIRGEWKTDALNAMGETQE